MEVEIEISCDILTYENAIKNYNDSINSGKQSILQIYGYKNFLDYNPTITKQINFLIARPNNVNDMIYRKKEGRPISVDNIFFSSCGGLIKLKLDNKIISDFSNIEEFLEKLQFMSSINTRYILININGYCSVYYINNYLAPSPFVKIKSFQSSANDGFNLLYIDKILIDFLMIDKKTIEKNKYGDCICVFSKSHKEIFDKIKHSITDIDSIKNAYNENPELSPYEYVLKFRPESIPKPWYPTNSEWFPRINLNFHQDGEIIIEDSHPETNKKESNDSAVALHELTYIKSMLERSETLRKKNYEDYEKLIHQMNNFLVKKITPAPYEKL